MVLIKLLILHKCFVLNLCIETQVKNADFFSNLKLIKQENLTDHPVLNHIVFILFLHFLAFEQNKNKYSCKNMYFM